MARLSAMIALVIGLVLAGPQNVVAQEAAQSGNKPDRTALPTDPSAQAQTSAEFDRTTLPMPRPPFEGTIGTTYKDSKSAWPRLPSPPSGAPNVVIILLDDVGFGQVSTFGGPVPTPNLDQLAQQGLRYNRFHTTAICGPSRAALITGRNHHNASSGFLSEWATGFPSYNNMMPRSTATIGAILKYNGYATAAAQHTFPWRQDFAPGNWDKDKWELYNLDEDFSEANDLASKYPEKLAELKRLFDQEAKKNNVYPLDDRGSGRLAEPKPSPGGSDPDRTKFTYFPGALRLPETASPNTKNRSHRISAVIEMPDKGGEGVILAVGGASAGFSLYVQDGHLVYHYNWFERERTNLVSDIPLPAGKSTVTIEFQYDGGGLGKGGTSIIGINGKEVGRAKIANTVAGRFGIDTFGVGQDTGSPVANTYKPPFTGKIDRVDIELGPTKLSAEDETKLHQMHTMFAASHE